MTYQQLLAGGTAGYPGVCRARDGKHWVARIKVAGHTTHIGTYSTHKAAVAARRLAEQKQR